MEIFIYSDESGILDKKHNKYFVFSGLVFLDKEEKESSQRKYKNAERIVRDIEKTPKSQEIKASNISKIINVTKSNNLM